MDETVHGSCLVVGEAGVLIRGEAGAGKSTLLRRLLLQARTMGLFACLVSDDRTRLEARNARLVARPVEAIAGLIEARGIGLTRQTFEPAAVLHLLIDISRDEPMRYPEEVDRQANLCGVMLPRIRIGIDAFSEDMILGLLTGTCDIFVTP